MDEKRQLLTEVGCLDKGRGEEAGRRDERGGKGSSDNDEAFLQARESEREVLTCESEREGECCKS